MPFNEIICPSCLKHVPMLEEQYRTFCIYCGNEIKRAGEFSNLNELNEDREEDWEKLFIEGKYNDIISAAAYYKHDDNGEISIPSVYYHLATMAELYESYSLDIAKEEKDRGAFSKMLSAFSITKSDDKEIHEDFFQKITQIADQLQLELGKLSCMNPSVAESCADKVVGLFLDYNKESVVLSVAVAYEMIEKFSISFFPMMSADDLTTRYDYYKKYGKRRLFSKTILKEMKQEINMKKLC